MIDPITAPILLKTLDWLFGEGSKILQERRKASQETGKEISGTATPPAVPANAGDAIQSKEVALRTPIVEAVWLDSEENIKHLLSLLEIHTRNYYLAKEQYAKWGSALVPPIVTHNLTEAENEIATTTKELQTVLSTVYGKKIAAPEVEQA